MSLSVYIMLGWVLEFHGLAILNFPATSRWLITNLVLRGSLAMPKYKHARVGSGAIWACVREGISEKTQFQYERIDLHCQKM